MNDKYNYKDSLNNIKASLFDIYEDQERLIELELDDNIKKIKIDNFYEIKNMASSIIKKIDELYDIENENTDSEEINNADNKDEEIELDNEEDIEENDFDEETDTVDDEKLKKYYLNSSFDKVNFAYVPKSIYENIKKNSVPLNVIVEEDIDDSIQDNLEKDLNLYKNDSESPRGIIVRSDQYMKLALSKHRQKTVLEEAKEYRKKEVARRQREEQKKELEKAELKFDI